MDTEVTMQRLETRTQSGKDKKKSSLLSSGSEYRWVKQVHAIFVSQILADIKGGRKFHL